MFNNKSYILHAFASISPPPLKFWTKVKPEAISLCQCNGGPIHSSLISEKDAFNIFAQFEIPGDK